MRIGILLPNQSPEDQPNHFVSKKLALKFLTYYHNGKKAVVRVSDNLLQITVQSLTFQKLKSLFRREMAGQPVRLPVRDWRQNLLLSYPHKDQSSFA